MGLPTIKSLKGVFDAVNDQFICHTIGTVFDLHFKEPEKWTNDPNVMLVDTGNGDGDQDALGGQEESKEPGIEDGGREATSEGGNQHGEGDNTAMLNQSQDEGTSNEVGEQSSEEEISANRHGIISEGPSRDEVSQTLQALAELGTESISLPQDF
jgi:hypothetical protein